MRGKEKSWETIIVDKLLLDNFLEDRERMSGLIERDGRQLL